MTSTTYIQIVDPDDPIFLNDVGQANPNFVVKYVDGSEVKNCVKYNGQRCNRVEWKADRIYNSEYSAELLESQQQIVGRMFWMEPNFVLPLAAKKYQTTYYFYYNPHSLVTGVGGGFGRTTMVHYYRDDGKVQTFCFDGYRPPFQYPSVGCVWYNGNNHFNYIRIHSSFDNWSNPPVLPQDDSHSMPPPSKEEDDNDLIDQTKDECLVTKDTEITGGLTQEDDGRHARTGEPKTEGLNEEDYVNETVEMGSAGKIF
jgi:hypothetical protein